MDDVKLQLITTAPLPAAAAAAAAAALMYVNQLVRGDAAGTDCADARLVTTWYRRVHGAHGWNMSRFTNLRPDFRQLLR